MSYRFNRCRQFFHIACFIKTLCVRLEVNLFFHSSFSIIVAVYFFLYDLNYFIKIQYEIINQEATGSPTPPKKRMWQKTSI